MHGKYLIGIDGGTESVRVGIYDIMGKQLGYGITEYKTYYPQVGWAEQNPNEWWTALGKSVQIALRKSSVKKEQIVGIGLDTTTPSIVLCKEDGTPLRPALLWMDIRASEEAEFISSLKDEALKYNGYGKVSPEWMVCKALWLKRNEQFNYERADRFLDFIDWYSYKLTGRYTGSISNTTYRWHYDPKQGGLPISFYEKIGINDLIDKIPKDICRLGDKIGKLTKNAAENLGLCPGVPVAQGGVDALNGIIGLGITKPGKLALLTGSSHNCYSLTNKVIHSKKLLGTFPEAVLPDYQLIEAGQSSSGSTIKWFRNNFCNDIEYIAQKKNTNVYDILNSKAMKIKAGSEGLIILDYWQGNRSPHVDPNVRGLISGLTLKHSREHIYRAIIEGIAYGTDTNIRNLRASGIDTSKIYAAGGATNSNLFLQIHADVSNIPIKIPEDNQVSCLGSAILASVAGGIYKDIEEAVENMVRYKDTLIVPDQENHKIYQLYSEQYRKAYDEFKKWMWENTKLNNSLN